MTPYYSDDLVTIYHGDCREVDAWLEADVVVTDPPYGRRWKQGDSGTRRGWVSDRHDGIVNDDTTAIRDYVLGRWSGRSIVFGDLMLAPPSCAKHVLIYDKGISGGFFGAVGGWRRNAEAIYLCGPGWKSGLGGTSCIIGTTGPTGGNLTRLFGHPHAKPDDVMRSLIRQTDGVVSDPFAGSGSTLIACQILGRRAIGIEIEEKYCEVAAKRLQQEPLRLDVA